MLGFIAVVFLAAGVIKGVVGIGMPTAAVSILSQVIDPKVAIPLILVPSLLSNLWQIYRSGRTAVTVRRFGVFIGCLVFAIAVVSTTVTAAVPVAALMMILGSVVIAFSLSALAWSPPFLPERFDRVGQVAGGLASGVLGGLTAIWAPPMITYLMARRVEKDDFVRAAGVLIFCGTVPLTAGFFYSGIMTGAIAIVSCIMTVPVIVGFSVGERIRRLIEPDRFRKVVLLMFLAMGANLLRRALI